MFSMNPQNQQYQEYLFKGQVFVLKHLFQHYSDEIIYNMACDVNLEITGYVQTILHKYSPEHALHLIKNRIREENIRKQHLIELQALETAETMLILSEKACSFAKQPTSCHQS